MYVIDMKRTIGIWTALVSLLLVSCTNDMDEELFCREELPVPITLAVAEANPFTRSVVNGIGDISVSSLGIYEVEEGTTAGTFPWTASLLLNNAAPTGINGNRLSFSSPLYYPAGGRKVIFYGYYPRTTATSGANYITPPGNGRAPIFNFTLTGKEDIMHAVSIPAGSSSAGTDIPIVFKHKLTQIKIDFSILSTLLSSIKILNVKNSGSMNLETGVITYGSSKSDITLSKAGLTSTSPVMVPADVPVYVIEVALLGTALPRKYVIKPTSGNFLAGTVYTISL